MREGTHFQPVIGDDSVSPADVTKVYSQVVFCSGKHCYALRKEREARKLNNMAIIRLEQLCPFPVEALRVAACRYPEAKGMLCWTLFFLLYLFTAVIPCKKILFNHKVFAVNFLSYCSVLFYI
uniref:Multifunctional 2-oxoglutarate metabolism enzyme C-terminal domain-containing protein n=1 Tax=Parascaris equorum TaxID=6256 RepID=A0A914R6Y7_PAREQ